MAGGVGGFGKEGYPCHIQYNYGGGELITSRGQRHSKTELKMEKPLAFTYHSKKNY